MGKVMRKRYPGEFKSRVALEAIRGEQTLAELALKHGMHQTMIAQWTRQVIESMASLFSRKAPASPADEAYHDVPTPSGPGLTPDQMANSSAVRMTA